MCVCVWCMCVCVCVCMHVCVCVCDYTLTNTTLSGIVIADTVLESLAIWAFDSKMRYETVEFCHRICKVKELKRYLILFAKIILRSLKMEYCSLK